jgi:hypothetical protein
MRRFAMVPALLGVVGLSCRSTPPRGPLPALSATPTAINTAPVPLAYAGEAGICRAQATDKGIQTAPCIPTPSPVDELALLKSGDIIVSLTSGVVVRESKGIITPLPLPPEHTWATPKPARTDVAIGPGSARKLVITGDEEIWQGRCAWVALQDYPACLSWVYARLSPSPARSETEPASRRDPARDEASSPPPGVEAHVEASPNSGAPLRVICSQNGATTTLTVPGAESAFTRGSLEWLGGSSPWYRLTVVHDYNEVVHGEVLLIKACDTAPGAIVGSVDNDETTTIVQGPGDLWLHPGEAGRWTLRRRERVLGSLPAGASTPVFAPPP